MTSIRPDIAARLVAVLVLLGLAVLPASAAAQDPAAPPPGSSGGTEATVGRPGLDIRGAALLNRTLALRGRAHDGDAGRPVRFEVQNPDGTWRPIASAAVGPDGAFVARWRADTAGRLTVRAVVDRPPDAATAASDPLVAQTTIFKPAVASWYGPGFWGRMTACRIKLTRKTVGVAHKTLPCGTKVELYYQGRTVTTTVIDRGPFVPGRDWDLTQATARQLGVKATVGIGALYPEPTAFRRRARKRSR